MNRAAEPGSEPLDHAIGRSRGGLSTKVHQLVDGKKRPLVVAVTAGQAGDSPMLKWLLADLAVARPARGCPRTRPDDLLGDKAYSSRANRTLLRSKRVRAVIPQRADEIGHHQRRGSAGGRPPAFDPLTYKRRNVVECSFNDHKHWRGIATRYDSPTSTAAASCSAPSQSGYVNNEPRPSDTEGRAYYRRKLAEGRTDGGAAVSEAAAVRCGLSPTHRQLIVDNAAVATVSGAGPGGHRGATQESSAADLHPLIDTSDQPLPGPATPTLRPHPADVKNLVTSTG